jgi:paraquat-inducible protein A
MKRTDLIACHECDALLRKPPLSGKAAARCPRCGATLYRGASAHLERVCAVTLGALITFLIAQAYPIVELDINGATSQTTLIGALLVLWGQDMQIVAAMVFCSTILFPLTELVALLYVLVPVCAGFMPPGFNRVVRVIQFGRPWGMIEVFMLGILVTVVKMVSLARVIPGPALFAFGALTLMFAVIVMFDPRTLWDIADALPRRGEAPRSPAGLLRPAAAGDASAIGNASAHGDPSAKGDVSDAPRRG